ncbi:KIN14D, partial [Symbiodinium microadriaticum]
ARAVQVFKSGNLTQQIARWLPPVKLVAFRRISPCCRQVVSDLLASDEALRNEVQAALQEVLHQKDNRVWVGIRVRNHSADAGSFAVDRRHITLANPSSSTASSTSFVFNRVFDHRANQMDVWSSIQAPLMRCVLRREHACLFAYGQTGSGKTYTMFGDPASPSESGLAFRVTDSLKQLLQSATCVEDRPSLEFSFLEVYNERVHDLLANSKVCVLAGEREELAPGSTYHAAKLGDEHVIVRGLTRRTCGVHDITEKISEWLLEGAAARIVGRTAFNPRSSRSHAVATIHVCWQPDPGTSAKGRETRLHIVDLAGSERSGQYAIDGEQLREGAHINLSLSTLGRVVGALARGQGEHVPYRDSSLTWLLSDAITGCHARAFMIATVQPEHAAETLSTLRYAQAYSSLQSDLSTKIPRLRAQVRSLLCQADMAQREVDTLCSLINDNARIGKMNQWSRETLKSRVVQIRRHGEELFRLHPYLKWTDVHDTKAKLAQIGLVEEVPFRLSEKLAVQTTVAGFTSERVPRLGQCLRLREGRLHRKARPPVDTLVVSRGTSNRLSRSRGAVLAKFQMSNLELPNCYENLKKPMLLLAVSSWLAWLAMGFAAKSCPAEDCAEGFCLPNAAVDELSFQAPCGFVDDWAGAPAAGRAFIPAANALVHGTTWDGYKRSGRTYSDLQPSSRSLPGLAQTLTRTCRMEETLLDDTPSANLCLSRRATVCPGVLQSKAARIDESESPHAGAGGQSPYRHLISSSSTLSAKNLELEAEPTGDRTVASSVKPATPKSRRELHEDLGRELEQLAKDLRNAQIIKSY